MLNYAFGYIDDHRYEKAFEYINYQVIYGVNPGTSIYNN